MRCNSLFCCRGDIIQRESDKYVDKNGPVDEGFVAVTTAGALPCQYPQIAEYKYYNIVVVFVKARVTTCGETPL